MHHGLDIAVPTGTPLGSTINGTVVYAGEGTKGSGYNGYGNVVAIKDENGNVHLFAHMDKVNVKTGDKISRGQGVGTSGNSGNSTGAHLHYEVRKNGELKNTIDPSPYLQFSGR